MSINFKAPSHAPGRILAAGVVGGLAEIAWVGTYALLAPMHLADIPREIAATVLPGTATSAAAPLVGVLIHFALSVVLALLWYSFIGRVLRRARALSTGVIIGAATGALVVVWAINFLIVLPALNPRFVVLLPVWVTLLSKVLFGMAMGSVFAAGTRLASRGQVAAKRWIPNYSFS